MLEVETASAVHPGGSGGAVVNSEGHMIGLVTSNARHGGGTVIPHLNFSIPCAALLPIFKFSKCYLPKVSNPERSDYCSFCCTDMQDLSLLQVLDQPSRCLSSVWALMPPLSPKPPPLPPHIPPSLLQDNNKESKGSRLKDLSPKENIFEARTCYLQVLFGTWDGTEWSGMRHSVSCLVRLKQMESDVSHDEF
ncbi:hypothetical protein DVH24_011493 [Malus domestica]|uniref:Peroxisomal leader peptide-processing protease n=1 Tax=Malus domestica TaxID=3750 RepID=A0A498JTI7_MALDO|nr:hypothetical protein DVH24_011493 [Malus domestica]